MAHSMNVTRRSAIAGLSSGATLLAAGGGMRVALAATPSTDTDILVVLFMRGGQDGLQLVAPAGDPNYIKARPSIRVQSSGGQAGLGVGTLSGVDMFLHPDLPDIKKLYDSGSLAIVQAVGIPTIDRSHFVCQDLMERGMGDKDTHQSLGWLARHTPSLSAPRAPLSTISSGTNMPLAIAGDATAVAISDVVYFKIGLDDGLHSRHIRALNMGDDKYQAAVRNMVDTTDAVQDGLRALKASEEIDYGYSAFGDHLSH